jgi:hypothetical protein
MEQKICDKFSLDSNTLITMYNNVHNNDKELCGYLTYFKQQDNTISLKIKDNSINVGTSEEYKSGDVIKTRESCKRDSSFFTSYEYHSHPAIISKSYPSYEDINTIYKHRSKDVSVIATQWGIYTIKKPYNFRNKYPNIPNTILSEMLNKYFYTIEKGRKKLPLTENDISKIKKGCDSIMRYTGLITRFCYWDNLL